MIFPWKLPEVAIPLATYLLAMYVVYEEGPAAIFLRFRDRLGIVDLYDENGARVGRSVEGGFWAKVFSCHRCAAPWLLVPVILLWLLFPPIVWFMALTGAVVLLGDISNS